MASLEDHAIRRDRSFLVRLALGLGGGLLFGLFVYGWLTGATVAACAARSLDGEARAPVTPR